MSWKSDKGSGMRPGLNWMEQWLADRLCARESGLLQCYVGDAVTMAYPGALARFLEDQKLLSSEDGPVAWIICEDSRRVDLIKVGISHNQTHDVWVCAAPDLCHPDKLPRRLNRLRWVIVEGCFLRCVDKPRRFICSLLANPHFQVKPRVLVVSPAVGGDDFGLGAVPRGIDTVKHRLVLTPSKQRDACVLDTLDQLLDGDPQATAVVFLLGDKHAAPLAERLTERGIKAAHVTLPEAGERAKPMPELDGETRVLVTTVHFMQDHRYCRFGFVINRIVPNTAEDLALQSSFATDTVVTVVVPVNVDVTTKKNTRDIVRLVQMMQGQPSAHPPGQALAEALRDDRDVELDRLLELDADVQRWERGWNERGR